MTDNATENSSAALCLRERISVQTVRPQTIREDFRGSAHDFRHLEDLETRPIPSHRNRFRTLFLVVFSTHNPIAVAMCHLPTPLASSLVKRWERFHQERNLRG